MSDRPPWIRVAQKWISLPRGRWGGSDGYKTVASGWNYCMLYTKYFSTSQKACITKSHFAFAWDLWDKRWKQKWIDSDKLEEESLTTLSLEWWKFGNFTDENPSQEMAERIDPLCFPILSNHWILLSIAWSPIVDTDPLQPGFSVYSEAQNVIFLSNKRMRMKRDISSMNFGLVTCSRTWGHL